jgi:hypothetical protein
MMAIEPGDVFRRVWDNTVILVVSLDEYGLYVFDQDKLMFRPRAIFEYCIHENGFMKL